jgi:hypothetical protein
MALTPQGANAIQVANATLTKAMMLPKALTFWWGRWILPIEAKNEAMDSSMATVFWPQPGDEWKAPAMALKSWILGLHWWVPEKLKRLKPGKLTASNLSLQLVHGAASVALDQPDKGTVASDSTWRRSGFNLVQPQIWRAAAAVSNWRSRWFNQVHGSASLTPWIRPAWQSKCVSNRLIRHKTPAKMVKMLHKLPPRWRKRRKSI